MRLSDRQAIALANPCATPEETLASEFARAQRIGSMLLVTMLTINK